MATCTPLLPPPVWAAAAALAQRAMSRHRHSTVTSRALGLVIAAASVLVGVSAVATLREANTTLGHDHPERARTLVRGGPFARTRNPIYLALTGLLLAHALWRRCVLAVAPALAFAVVMDRTQIPREEEALRSRFGRDFERYEREVPRWAPVRR